MAALIEHLKAMTKPELVAQLRDLELPTDGLADQLRTRLGEHLWAHGWTPPADSTDPS
jgi:hypothetical protein